MLPPFDEIPTFVHTAEFDADWKRLGLSDEDTSAASSCRSSRTRRRGR